MTTQVHLTSNGGNNLALAQNEDQGEHSYRFSGFLDETLTVDDLSDDYVTWVSAASREGSLTVVVTYDSVSAQTFLVEPGYPLLFQSRADDTVADVSFAPTDTDCHVEIYTYTGDSEINAEEPAALILDANLGVTETAFSPGTVDAWEDTRPESIATAPFGWSSGAGPALTTDDEDFGGQATLDFSQAPAGYFSYDGAPVADLAPVFIESDYTFFAVFEAYDEAVDAEDDYGIWYYGGVGVSVDPAFRPNPSDATPTDYPDTHELSPKPTVLAMRYNHSGTSLEVYWQGRWRDSQSGTFSSSSSTLLFIGRKFGGTFPTFNGKIAYLRWHSTELSVTRCEEIVAALADRYGLDDTVGDDTFPHISDADVVTFARANRGLDWSDPDYQTTLAAWHDTRPGADSGADQWLAATETPGHDDDDDVLGAPAWTFDGSSQALTNTFSGTSGDHLAGDGMTIGLVFYTSAHDPPSGLWMQGDYASATLEGTSIFTRGNKDTDLLTYETDNSADDDVILEDGTMDDLSVARAIVLRGDGSNWYIDELNIDTGETYRASGAYGGTESTSTSAAVYLFTDAAEAQHRAGGLAEAWTAATSMTFDEVTEYFEYCQARYGSS